MAESAGTLRELLTGFNSMSAQLGLFPSSGQAQGIQPIPMQPLKSPAQFAEEATRQLMQQTQATVSTVQQIRALPPPSPAGAFAQDFSAGMRQIQGNYMPPYLAQAYSGALGAPGFQGLPSPVYQTAPHMGIYRPPMAAPPPLGMSRQMPLMQMPWTPVLPPPRFQMPMDLAYQQGMQSDESLFAGIMSAMPTMGFVGGGMAGVGMLGGLGRRLGGRFGGVAGMGLGALGFGISGGMGQSLMGSISTPLVQTRLMGRQLEEASRGWVVGGSDLSELGQGLNARASIRLANGLTTMATGQRFREETGGMFNTADVMKITQAAGASGMLDMAQSGPQIQQQVRNVARSLANFMQLAQEPDVQRAMSQMAQMRHMGLTLPETTVAMQNARQFARMAGTTVQDLGATAGAPGGMMFQQMGLSAGLGWQVGGAAAGWARQAIAGGALSQQQLAMAGGQRGLQQTLTEAAGATLGVNFTTLAMMKRGSDGQLTIDSERVKGLLGGRYSLEQQAAMGADNVSRLGGERVISELTTQLSSLKDQLGRQLGAQGSVMLLAQQAMQFMKSTPGVGLEGALTKLTGGVMDPNQLNGIAQMIKSPGMWRGLEQQQLVRIDEARMGEAARREKLYEATGFTGMMNTVMAPLRNMGVGIERSIEGARGGITSFLARRDAMQRMQARGGAYAEIDPGMRISDRERAAIAAATANSQGLGGGEGSWTTPGQLAGAMWNVGSSVGSAASMLLGPVGTAVGLGLSMTPNSVAGQRSQGSAAISALGGGYGAAADMFGGSWGVLMGSVLPSEMQPILRARAASVESVGRTLNSALGMSSSRRSALRMQLDNVSSEYSRGRGGKKIDVEKEMADAISEAFGKNVTFFGTARTTTSAEVKEAVRARLMNLGMSTAEIENYLGDSGSGQQVMRLAYARAYERGTDKERASMAKTMDQAGYGAAAATGALAELAAGVADRDKGLRLGIGGATQGMFGMTSAITDAAWGSLKTSLIAENDETMQARAAYALRRSGNVDAAKAIEDSLSADVVRSAEAFGKDRTTEELAGYAGLGKQLSGRTAEGRVGFLSSVRKTTTQDKAVLAAQAGAAALGFSGAAHFMGSDESVVDEARSVLNDQTKLRAVKARSSEMYSVLSEAAGMSGEAQTAFLKRNAGRLRSGLVNLGASQGGTIKGGGRGVGGAEEQVAQEQLGNIQALGNAAINLDKAATKIHDAFTNSRMAALLEKK